jgi:hypothetical protein
MSGSFKDKIILSPVLRATIAVRMQCVSLKRVADVIAVDICEQIDSVAYGMATADDMQETVYSGILLGRRYSPYAALRLAARKKQDPCHLSLRRSSRTRYPASSRGGFTPSRKWPYVSPKSQVGPP